MGFSAKSLPIWQTVLDVTKMRSVKKTRYQQKGFLFQLCSSFIFLNISSSLNLRKAFPSRQICSQHVQLGKRKTSSFWIWKKKSWKKERVWNSLKEIHKKSSCCLLLGFGLGLFCLKTIRWPEGSIRGCKWQYQAMIWSKQSSNSHPLPNSWDRAQNQMFRCFVTT